MATSTDSALPVGTTLHADLRHKGAPVFVNVCFGIFDYLVQPLLMLATAKFFVHHLGISEFGLWMLILAIVGSTGTVCTGFGDAALKYISSMRGRSDSESMLNVIRASLGLNLVFGLAMCVVFFLCAPWASGHIFRLEDPAAAAFSAALRIGGGVLVIRSVSFVFISTLRACESYRTSTLIASFTRTAIIASALALAVTGHGIVAIMGATLACEAVAIAMLARASQKFVGPIPLRAGFDFRSCRALTSFGALSWLQALSGTLFSQADRLLVATLLGPAALGYYGVCVQAAQPIHGLAASGSNVLFPHMSSRMEWQSTARLRSTIDRAFWLNFIFVLALALPLIFLSRPILSIWLGADFSRHASSALSLVALSFAFLAFNIPGHYALMALGRIRFLTGVNLAGGLLALLLACFLIPRFGIAGAAIARLSYGPLTWMIYPKVRDSLRQHAITFAS